VKSGQTSQPSFHVKQAGTSKQYRQETIIDRRYLAAGGRRRDKEVLRDKAVIRHDLTTLCKIPSLRAPNSLASLYGANWANVEISRSGANAVKVGINRFELIG